MSDVKQQILDELTECKYSNHLTAGYCISYNEAIESAKQTIIDALEGMAIVPVEPTQHMINASAHINDCFSDEPAQLNNDIYTTMVAAFKEQS